MSRKPSPAPPAQLGLFGQAPAVRRLVEPLCAAGCGKVGGFGFHPPREFVRPDEGLRGAVYACGEHRAAVEADWRARYGIN